MVRVTVWGENVHERRDQSVRAIYPEGMHATIASGLIDAARRRGPGAHRHARPARARADRGGPGRDRRAHVVGPHRPRRCRATRSSTRVHDAVLGGMGLLALHSAHYSKILKRAARHLLQPALAQRRRARAGVDGRPVAPDRAGRPAPDRDRRAGDVRRALRHPGARRARVRLQLRGRRGVPQRLLLRRAARAGSSTSAPATRSTPSTTTRTSSGCWPTRCSGPRRARAGRCRTRPSPRATGGLL